MEVLHLNKESFNELSWEGMGLSVALCSACKRIGWLKPTKIQSAAIPPALQGRDVIGLAETGSGKTGAFILPILHVLLEHSRRYFALILTPTRELAFQIAEQIDELGREIGVTSCVLVGGMDMVDQAVQISKKPHVIIATPGRLVDHLENTKGFNLNSIKYLVMDEADRILNMDFEAEVAKILTILPKDRFTMLFSATMTQKVAKLQRASLKDPAKVEVSTKFQTVERLLQYYVFLPLKYKDTYLVYVLNSLPGNSLMIFCSTCSGTLRIACLLRVLGFQAVPLHGQMSQNKRIEALETFKNKSKTILVSTDVASRGLDIEHVDVVINFDIPTHSKDYIHRVGRTARAGRAGRSITFVTQYDVELYQRIEFLIGKKLPAYTIQEKEVMELQERVMEAQKITKQRIKDMDGKNYKSNKKKQLGQDDSEHFNGVHKRLKNAKR